MKNNIIQLIIVVCWFLAISLTSCEKEFLEKPTGNELVADSIFANSLAAKGAIARAYAQSLPWGIQYTDFNFEGQNQGNGLLHGDISHIANENIVIYTWEYSYRVASSGMMADNGSGIPQAPDRYLDYWDAIRVCYLNIDNIDKVPDMSDTEKEQVKGEMKALIAYTYEEMFKRYGGVPIVTKSLAVEDEILIPRSPLQDVVDFVVQLCDEAADVLPNSYPLDDYGRLTKGAALAIKAEILTYAARPLFNSATPYLSGEDNSLWSFGNYNESRWQDAIDANLEVIDWAESNGYTIIDTDNPLEDFGVATSTPGNNETLLAYKDQYGLSTFFYFSPFNWEPQANGPSYETLTQFRKEDGTDQTWTDETPAPFMEYFDKCDELEPRFKASISRIGGDAENNPGDQNWEAAKLGAALGNEHVGRRIKFWAGAGTRNWFEYALYRLPEFYLNLAEAYNEIGNSSKSLEYLNVVRDRGGIPDEVITDKDLLRKSIQREWAVEFYQEYHRLYDLKHWKIAANSLGGPRLTFGYELVGGNNTLPSDFVSYYRKSQFDGFWAANQHLSPFPIGEVNKGYLIQNPGY